MKEPFPYKLRACLIFIYLLSFASCSEFGEELADVRNKRNNLDVGASARDILSDDSYKKLIIEIQYVTGYKPPLEVVENLEAMLKKFVFKPEGIIISTSEIRAPGKAVYSNAEIRALENINRTEYTRENTIAVYILFVDGVSDTENTLGIAYKNTSIIIFQKTINDFLNISRNRWNPHLTSRVVSHEIGHLLGLVNADSQNQSDHQDVANGKHCIVQDCLMNWRITQLDIFFSNNIPSSFDALCIADLRASGGK